MYKLRFLLTITLLFTLSGCAGQSVGEDTIRVWHWMSDREDAFVELAQNYEAETGIKVKFDLYAPSESYTQKIKAAAQTSTLPDVFGVLGESRDLAAFVKADFVADLSEAMGQKNTGSWRDRFFEKAVSVNTFKPNNEFDAAPGVYGVPLDVSTIQWVYNKDLFRQAGLDPENPPKTWIEFTDAAKVLQQNNIPVLVGGFGEIWMLDALSSNWAMNLMGEDKVFDTYRGNVSYLDPDWIRVLQLFKQMADDNVLVSGAVTMVNKSSEQTFANGRAAFAFNGSWCVNVYKGMNPALDYAAILPPRLSLDHPMKVWGGAGSSFMVHANSPRKEQAIEFLRWLTDKDQQATLANATNNLPANKQSLEKISPILSQFADDIDNTTHPNVYPVHEYHQVSEAWCKGIQSILIGEKTPAEVATEVQAVKEREIARENS
ncbi:MAG: ABC-type glycerol-3-phosphate transport system substrate-binding protein [Candidatus Omnitrophota bacterium]|jgi:ABC-type glycerol-3-phosphate transport system substrate-binding protein